jgi:DNA-binding response OmpR family regulator
MYTECFKGRMVAMPQQIATVAGPFQPDAAHLSKMRILIIDDEASNVALLEAMLADAGYTCVQSILDSRLALETYKSFQPDLVLLDLMMPHVDGFAVLEALRREADATVLPIIILTADTNGQSRMRAFHGGATDFLLKPLDYAEVLLRIANVLETRRLQRVVVDQRAKFDSHTTELRSALWELENSKSTRIIM